MFNISSVINRIKGIRSQKDWFRLLSLLLLFLSLAYVSFFLLQRMDYLVTSDDVSNELHGRVLQNEKCLISTNWYNSTQLSVLGSHLFYALFFTISSNWTIVKVLSSISMMICLLVIEYYMCKLNGAEYYYIMLAVFFCIPFSSELFEFTLVTGFYTFVMTIPVINYVLAELFVQKDGRIVYIILFVSVVMSFLAGCEGFKQLLYTYLPLFLASFLFYILKTKARWFKYSTITIIGWIIGYILNITFFSRIFTFASWDIISFTEFNFEGIEIVFNGLLTILGYTKGPVMSLILLKNVISAIWILLALIAVIYGIWKRAQVSEGYFILSLCCAISIVMYILLYSFTDMLFENRYLYGIAVLSVPLISSLFTHFNLASIKKKLICAVLVAVTIIISIPSYQEFWNSDNTKEYRLITEKLLELGYYNGYASFWNSNILTYLSDGEIDVWNLGFELKDTTGTDEIHKYLQVKTHDHSHPTGKTFLILSDKEMSTSIWKNSLNDNDIILKTDSHVVYGYQSFDELTNKLYEYDFTFDNYDFFSLPENSIGDSGAVITNGQMIFGPNITLPKGNYVITIYGDNLNNAYTNISSSGDEIIPDMWDTLESDNDDIIISLNLTQTEHGINFVIQSGDTASILVKRLVISKQNN